MIINSYACSIGHQFTAEEGKVVEHCNRSHCTREVYKVYPRFEVDTKSHDTMVKLTIYTRKKKWTKRVYREKFVLNREIDELKKALS